jgi:hydroxymethylglutaryl-CoA lyase
MNALSFRTSSFSSFSACRSHQRFFSQQTATLLNNRKVTITETTLRDGLQASSRSLPTHVKQDVIRELVQKAKIFSIEIGSMVDPKRVPNMADTPHLIQNITQQAGIDYWVLVANQKGLDTALEKGAKAISFPTAASDAFLKKNINCSIDESFKRIEKIMQKGKALEGTRFRVYISCCPICPEEGEMPVDKIADLVHRLYLMKCDEIFPSDTVGQATPQQIRKMLEGIQKRGVPISQHVGLHLHGHGSQVLENVKEALSVGVRLFDSAMGHLGGCPVVKQAKGNIPTEELVPFLHQLGYETGIEIDPLLKIRKKLMDELNLSMPSS